MEYDEKLIEDAVLALLTTLAPRMETRGRALISES